jgi:hypothetical protein
MAQKTFTAAVLTATDINTYLSHEGGAWTAYTPVLTQGATPTLTVTRAVYAREGRKITVSLNLAITSAGTANTNVVVTLPVTAAHSAALVAGAGYILDNSATAQYPGLPYLASTTTVGLMSTAGTALGLLGATGTSFTAALASADVFQASFVYESAT